MRWVLGVLAACLLTFSALWLASRLEASSKQARVIRKSNDSRTLVVDIEPERRGDYAVYCNEDRYQGGFDRFRRFVGIKTEPILAPGGPMLIALADVELDPELQAPQRVLVEVLKRYSPDRIVVMAHEGCLIYDSVGAWFNDPVSVRRRQYADLRKARDVLATWFPRSQVELFYGQKIGETKLQFSPLPEDSLKTADALPSP